MGVKLSEILYRYEKLKSLSAAVPKDKMKAYISDINSAVDSLKFIESHELKKLESTLIESMDEYFTLVKKITSKLKDTVDSNHKQYLEQNKVIWQTNLEKMLFHEHLEWARLWPPTEIEYHDFRSHLKQYINWQYPGLIVGAKESNLINSLVGTEPLYVVERYVEYFELQKNRFPINFSRKLRFYDINNLHLLPHSAIGIAVVYNEFNFMPWEFTQNILTNIAKTLRPGGVLVFNYNDCETSRGFLEFENWSMTYSTSDMFEKHLKKYDLDLITKYLSKRETFSYMIFRKQGHKDLIKKNPSIGYVKQQTITEIEHKNRIDKISKLINGQ